MTTGNRPRILAIATVALLISGSVNGSVIAHGPDPALSGGPFGQNQVLKFHWRAGSEPPVVIKDAIKQAVDQAVLKLSMPKSAPVNESRKKKKG